MADGTRLKQLDESIKALQESNQSLQLSHSEFRVSQHNLGLSQEALRSDVFGLAESLEDQKKTMNKVLVQLSLLTKQSKSRVVGSGEGGSADGISVFGRHKPAPICLARFAGDQPERWVAQANRYFEFYSIPDVERLMIASFYLDEDAADWFDWLQRHSQLTDWNGHSYQIRSANHVFRIGSLCPQSEVDYDLVRSGTAFLMVYVRRLEMHLGRRLEMHGSAIGDAWIAIRQVGFAIMAEMVRESHDSCRFSS